MLLFLGNISKKIQLLGIQKGIEDTEKKAPIPPYIIEPEGRVKTLWDMLLIVLLAYTATYMPYKTCFIDESSTLAEAVDWSVDGLFMVDILINFLAATENPDGSWNTSPRRIARDYLRGWFACDLISVMPFSLFEQLVPKAGDSAQDQSAAGYN